MYCNYIALNTTTYQLALHCDNYHWSHRQAHYCSGNISLFHRIFPHMDQDFALLKKGKYSNFSLSMKSINKVVSKSASENMLFQFKCSPSWNLYTCAVEDMSVAHIQEEAHGCSLQYSFLAVYSHRPKETSEQYWNVFAKGFNKILK